jgi:hypothetical protein
MDQQFQWQGITIIFNNEGFREGFERGRDLYFHGGLCGCDETGALHLIAIPDSDGDYQFDEHMGVDTSLEELVGVLAGFLSGLTCPETRAERLQWEELAAQMS